MAGTSRGFPLTLSSHPPPILDIYIRLLDGAGEVGEQGRTGFHASDWGVEGEGAEGWSEARQALEGASPALEIAGLAVGGSREETKATMVDIGEAGLGYGGGALGRVGGGKVGDVGDDVVDAEGRDVREVLALRRDASRQRRRRAWRS